MNKHRSLAVSAARIRPRGFTLIEVLVSIIILSIGMLGIAGLQAATARYKMNTWARSASAVLFSDFADRVRANPSQAGNAYGDAVQASSYTWQQTWANQIATPVAPAQDCMVVSCTPVERAAYDLATWRMQVRQTMPGGSAWVEGTRATGINVTVMWTDQTHVGVGASEGDLETTPSCAPATPAGVAGMAYASCCPAGANVVPGVRCLRFSFLP